MPLSVISLLIILALILIPLFFGIKKFNTNRKISIVLLLIPLIIFGVIYNFIYNLMYITSPEALDLELIQKNQEYLVNGRWIKKFERYSYGKDFIAIHLPEGTIISSSSLKNFEIIKEEDTYLSEDLNAVIKKNPNYDSSKNITLFMIDLSREFQFTFELNNFLSKNDVTIQYVHVYYPPMDFLRYWVKTINGVYEDPKEMNR